MPAADAPGRMAELIHGRVLARYGPPKGKKTVVVHGWALRGRP